MALQVTSSDQHHGISDNRVSTSTYTLDYILWPVRIRSGFIIIAYINPGAKAASSYMEIS